MFEKSKAMRSAERYLSQGKIRDAIREYRQVVDHDPRDVITLNMLGDLYSKNSDARSAVRCYMNVADHYSRHGFAQKAIAVYNKISRINPNSAEVTRKLAELYRVKGSLKEAKSHYTALAEHYNSQGRRIEALEIWSEVAVLDPNNTEVYLTIADAYRKEGRPEDAAGAYCSAGERFLRHSLPERAVDAYRNALQIDPDLKRANTGLAEALFASGNETEAIDRLASLLEAEPLDRGLHEQLVAAHLRNKDPKAAEPAVLRLVELEPASYLKCLELAQLYFDTGDVDSTVRILTIASEHLLAGGQAGELAAFLEKIEAKEPDRLDSVRLLSRFCSWQKDDEYLRTTLIRLFEIASRDGSIDDERNALMQLVVILPQNPAYAERLNTINQELGIAEDTQAPNQKDGTPGSDSARREISNGNGSDRFSGEAEHLVENDEFAILRVLPAETPNVDVRDRKKNKKHRPSTKETIAEKRTAATAENDSSGQSEDFQKEVDSIKFYIENGYNELALKAIADLRENFGDDPRIDELLELNRSWGEQDESHARPVNEVSGPLDFEFGDLQSELGLEDAEQAPDRDFETQYQTAIAYQEMGLIEQAISEFQDAAALVSPDDGTRRFFNCANLLGHCFMEMGKPNLSVKWHLRSLESLEISAEERQGVWFELGVAYQAHGDLENAVKYFEQVYAENIDFRDIGERMKTFGVSV